MDDQIFVVLTVLLVLYVSYTMYTESDYFQLKCVISDAHQKTYCVRERKMLGQAADLLAGVADKLDRLVKHMQMDYPNDEMEAHRSGATEQDQRDASHERAHSAQREQGEKLALCLNEKKEDADSRLIDENTLMYVAMHELAPSAP